MSDHLLIPEEQRQAEIKYLTSLHKCKGFENGCYFCDVIEYHGQILPKEISVHYILKRRLSSISSVEQGSRETMEKTG